MLLLLSSFTIRVFVSGPENLASRSPIGPLVKHSLPGSTPELLVDTGVVPNFVFLISTQRMLMMLAQESHLDNDWLIESRNFLVFCVCLLLFVVVELRSICTSHTALIFTISQR